jgi:AcrR family transcriptional regulator
MTVSADGAIGRPGRPLRRDAAENRERLLVAASLVFTEHGFDGSVEEVARAAGVGMGTLYRRFPTKQALIDELVGGVRRELLGLARAAAQHTDGQGLEELLVHAGQLQADHLGCLERVWDYSDAEQDAMREVRRILHELLVSAQELGRVRRDVTITDITMILWSLRGVIGTTRTIAPNAWRRHLELLVAGLRPVTDGPFTSKLREKPLTDAQAQRVTGAVRR